MNQRSDNLDAPKHLQDGQLRQSLTGELDEQLESSLLQHLEWCDECRERMDRMAADSNAWDRIDRVLRAEADSQRSSGLAAGSRLLPAGGDDGTATPDNPPIFPGDYAAVPADFAVSFLDPSSRPEALGKLGDFEILSVIGCGGMGIVLKGFQEELNRPVAVKVLAPHLATSGAARQRFLREAQATASIVHPNVMPILSVSEQARLPFLVMPYIACHSLQQRLDSEGALPVEDILRIAHQVARGLAAAHAQGLVHRDVKPANILLERGIDRAMLTDFGLARAVDDASLTRSGVIAGTPQYMSPEQARGDAIDRRSDLFSLGSVMYAMSVGRPPFRGDTSYGILRKITDHPPRSIRESNARIPAWLERLIFHLLAKEPEQRYERAEEVAELLEQCLAHIQQPTGAALPSSLRQARRTRGDRRKWLAGIAGSLLGLILLVGSAIFWNNALPTSLQSNDVTQNVVPDAATATSAVASEPARRTESSVDGAQLQQRIEGLKSEMERIISDIESDW